MEKDQNTNSIVYIDKSTFFFLSKYGAYTMYHATGGKQYQLSLLCLQNNI